MAAPEKFQRVACRVELRRFPEREEDFYVVIVASGNTDRPAPCRYYRRAHKNVELAFHRSRPMTRARRMPAAEDDMTYISAGRNEYSPLLSIISEGEVIAAIAYHGYATA